MREKGIPVSNDHDKYQNGACTTHSLPKWCNRAILTVLCLVLVFIICFEVNHYSRFKHLVGYGLYVDLLHEPMSFGIPGVTSAYSVQLSNYSLVPEMLEACQMPNDITPFYTLDYRGQIERFEPATRRWQVLRRIEPSDCPVTDISKPVEVRLLPGQSETIWGWDAVAAMVELSKGDSVRFRLFTRFREPDESRNQRVLVSPAFVLTEESLEHQMPASIRH